MAATLKPEVLAAWIKDPSKKAKADFLVVDVRPRFDGGRLIFHCHHSLHKGPASASNYLKTVGASEGQEVFVLEGGYAKWAETYASDLELIENTTPKPEDKKRKADTEDKTALEKESSSKKRAAVVVAQTLKPEALVSWLRDEKLKAHKDYLVVDVRPRFDGGSQYPREEFNESDKALLQAPCKLVFHCHHSLHKGPASAANYLKTVGASEGQEVYVLEGGYAKWAEVYFKEKDLVENLKKDEE
ncbi:hypothetical protein BDR26DRAFT_902277 [Obelidium mucronatum]|nr:hypothetical protein BDR26DRAFT_902277 [Obelidium mucronatum]